MVMLKKHMGESWSFFKLSKNGTIWWVNTPDKIGLTLFSFDKETIFSFWTDYPRLLSEEQIQIFDKENSYLANLKKKGKQENLELYKNAIFHSPLRKKDKTLLIKKADICVPITERMFYDALWDRLRSRNVILLERDELLASCDNEEGIYINIMLEDDVIDIEIGCTKTCARLRFPTMADTLNLSLKKLGLNKDITVLQWLKERDYQGIQTDHFYSNFNRVKI